MEKMFFFLLLAHVFQCSPCRTVKQWAVCHPKNSDSTLTSLHLENNLLQVEAIPPKAFSCLTDTQGLVLYPQQV